MGEMREFLCGTCTHGYNKIVYCKTSDNSSECTGVNCTVQQPFTRNLRDKCSMYEDMRNEKRTQKATLEFF